MKPDTEPTRSMQDLSYDMMMLDDKYQPSVMAAANDMHQTNMIMSTLDDPLTSSFTSTTSAGSSWDAASPTSAALSSQPFVFRPSSSMHRADNFASTDSVVARTYPGSLAAQLTGAVSACAPAPAFDSLHVQTYLSPQQLVIPHEVNEPDAYSYVQAVDSSMTSPTEQSQIHSTSFDSLSSMSPWSQIDPSSPIHEYVLPGNNYVDSGTMVLKEESSMSSMLAEAEYDQHSPITPRRSRLRGKPGSSKRCRAMTHQLAHNYYGVDVAIDSKSLKVDGNGRITKKHDGVETKRWKCTHAGCESRSARKEHLRRHELSHMPEKQFHCNLPKCNRAITRSDNLIQHLMTHVRPLKAGKRNNHHGRKKVERMVLDTMKDAKLAERTITNLRKAIEREQDKWPHGFDADDTDCEPNESKAGATNDEEIENLKYET